MSYFFGNKNVQDSNASVTEKNVILCRSGTQLYRRFEVEGRFDLDMEGHDEESFIEYRPPDVVVAAKELMANLPVTKEHPSSFVTPDNWNRLAHGTTGSEVDVVSLGDGEIGIETSIIFNTRDIYNYYVDGNKEVSLGYACEKRWATEEEKSKYGCDIVLTKITEVNHLAVTSCGRGGSKVAILDSFFRGLKKMRSGLFFYLDNKGKNADANSNFSDILFTALESCNGKEEEAVKNSLSNVLDAFASAKDSEAKKHLSAMVEDCFTDIPKALAHKKEIAPIVNDAWINISGESIKDIKDALSLSSPSTDALSAGTEEGKKEEGKKEGEKVNHDDGKGKNTANVSDSNVEEIVKKAVTSAMAEATDSFRSLVQEEVKKVLQIDSSTEGGSVATDSMQREADLELVKDIMLG